MWESLVLGTGGGANPLRQAQKRRVVMHLKLNGSSGRDSVSSHKAIPESSSLGEQKRFEMRSGGR